MYSLPSAMAALVRPAILMAEMVPLDVPSVTCCGVLRVAVCPIPNWPSSLYPHVHNRPSTIAPVCR